MKTIIEYDVNVLLDIVRDYFCEETELQMFLKTWTPGWGPNKPPEERISYAKHDERATATWKAIVAACRLVDADIDTLIAVVKSIDRYEKHSGKYDRCVHFYNGSERHFRRMVAKDDGDSGYYTSTGRKKK